MKKILFLLLCTIFGVQTMNAQEAYAVYSGTALTFYYDSNKSSRDGIVYSLNGPGEDPQWVGNYKVYNVTFDSSFKNYRPKSTRNWFSDFRYWTSITGYSNLNTSEVTDMSGMFDGCSSLKSVQINILIDNLNTAKVTDMSNMFRGCSELKILDLSGLDISKVTNMSNMFYNCSSLLIIYVDSNWNTDNVTSSTNMFYGCSKLEGANGTVYNAYRVDKTYACIDGAKAGYLTLVGTVIPYVLSDGEGNLVFNYDSDILQHVSTSPFIFLII